MPADPNDLAAALNDPRVLGAFAAGLAVASLAWAAWLRHRVRRVLAEAVASAADSEQRAAEAHRHEVGQLERWLEERSQALIRAEGRIEQLEAHLGELREESARRAEEAAARRSTEAELRTRLEETQRNFSEKEALFRENSDALKQEFELLANKIFERQGEQHRSRLDDVLKPLKTQLSDFRERVETVYTTETKDRASLLAEVRNLQQASERINREAENLTKALKGDVKTQGNWGEMVLERVLESSGLRAGEEYFVQESRRDDEGSLKRPDVLIRLPDDKDVVVDAKLSLLAYEEALAEEGEEARAAAMTRHVASLRNHVKRLAEQHYDQLPDVRSLDFVLLFVPIEAAFTMAMEQDQRLFSEAFERRIVIVSPTTLMMTLRIIHNVWRYEKQNRNAQEIARRAGALYDKVRGFVEDMEALGRQLQTAENTYQQAVGKLSTGKGNVLRRVEQLRELGAPVKKALPQHLISDDDALEAGENDDDDAPDDDEIRVREGESGN
jgi:DNA recombination protein RmuC|tara:strand:- start:106 stop:1605 length:1500 start_codon:yes stop_codon:yes gene_type:complete